MVNWGIATGKVARALEIVASQLIGRADRVDVLSHLVDRILRASPDAPDMARTAPAELGRIAASIRLASADLTAAVAAIRCNIDKHPPDEPSKPL
jgi:hypothetical protein